MSTEGKKDPQSTDAAWNMPAPPIEGLLFHEIRNVVTERSIVRELYRKDWRLHDREIRHMISVTCWPQQIMGWHKHLLQTDHVFVVHGTFKAVLYDDRDDSRTRGTVHVMQLSDMRPGVLLIPPGIWHAFRNLTPDVGILINYFDREYQYDDPDEYKLPPDTPEIPYTFD
jgi:dTDP-4-dehydrorhamnose 3,5-epimerase